MEEIDAAKQRDRQCDSGSQLGRCRSEAKVGWEKREAGERRGEKWEESGEEILGKVCLWREKRPLRSGYLHGSRRRAGEGVTNWIG